MKKNPINLHWNLPMKKIHVMLLPNWKVVIIVVRRNVNDLRNGRGGIRVSSVMYIYLFVYVYCFVRMLEGHYLFGYDCGVCFKGGNLCKIIIQ